MPVLIINSNQKIKNSVLENIQLDISEVLEIPRSMVWISLNEIFPNNQLTGEIDRPIVFFNCRQNYTDDAVKEAVKRVQIVLARTLNISSVDVICIVNRVSDKNVHSPFMKRTEIKLESLGIVYNERSEHIDDNWNSIISVIKLDSSTLSEDATEGLTQFSHIEVVFHMDKVDNKKIVTGARHPRNNLDWPKVGILSQRGKNRPNKIGVSRCRLLKCEGLVLTVQGLDAINETPVIDIKPWMSGFLPSGIVSEPTWAVEIMQNYYEEL